MAIKQLHSRHVTSTASPAATPKTPLGPRRGNYPGSKFQAGVWQRIIQEMPPHSTYVEACAGRAAIFQRKLPAAHSILIDRDPKCCNWLRSHLAANAVGDVEVRQGDVLQLLTAIPAVRASDTLIYLDPPYLMKTRRSRQRIYCFEAGSLKFHKALLELAVELDCMVMISGYASELYARKLKQWRRVDYTAMTHRGPVKESLWCNFPPAVVLHDARLAGVGYRERDNIRRVKKRWAGKFAGMSSVRRQAVATALIEVDRFAVEAALGILTATSPLAPGSSPNGDSGVGSRSRARGGKR